MYPVLAATAATDTGDGGEWSSEEESGSEEEDTDKSSDDDDPHPMPTPPTLVTPSKKYCVISGATSDDQMHMQLVDGKTHVYMFVPNKGAYVCSTAGARLPKKFLRSSLGRVMVESARLCLCKHCLELLWLCRGVMSLA